MSATDQPEQQDAMLLEEAMEWFMLLRDAPENADHATAWKNWLQVSDAHTAAWDRICRTWAALGEPPHMPAATTAPTLRRHGASQRFGGKPHRFRRGLGAMATSLMSIALAVTFFGPALQIRLEADFQTGAGETEIITLADGSRVTLAPQTALAEKFDGTSRHVQLLSGEAFFEVERDTARPFVVDAEDASIRVMGTAFSVRDTGDGTRVELAHGSIALRPRRAPDGHELALTPGDVANVDREDGKAELSRIDPSDIALWRQGRLSVTDQSLGDVLALIQRQHSAWIMLAQSDLAALRVTGLYDLRDPDQALFALAAAFDLKVRTASPYLRILSSH